MGKKAVMIKNSAVQRYIGDELPKDPSVILYF